MIHDIRILKIYFYLLFVVGVTLKKHNKLNVVKNEKTFHKLWL